MLKLPLVSFVVTSYNYEKYILKTLESIKSQTYSNFEIIIVDDCSTDRSIDVIEQFIQNNQDLKITLLKQKRNSGQLASMLRGLRESRGQFVSFIDSDDVLMSEYASSHVKVHLETSVAFTSCRIIEIGANDEIHTFNSVSSPDLSNDLTYFSNDIEGLADIIGINVEYKTLKWKRFGGWYWSPNSSAMYRKASIEILLNYKNTEKWRVCPDKFIFNFAQLIGGSAIINEPLVAYRRHNNNAGKSFMVTGDKRFHNDAETIVNVLNNMKIRPETIKFLWQERKKLGLRNTIRLIFLSLL